MSTKTYYDQVALALSDIKHISSDKLHAQRATEIMNALSNAEGEDLRLIYQQINSDRSIIIKLDRLDDPADVAKYGNTSDEIFRMVDAAKSRYEKTPR